MMIVSWILTFFSLIFIYEILDKFYSKSIVYMSLSLFALNPYSIYLFNGYSEPIWIFTVALFLYFLLVKQNYFLSSLAIILASLSRPYGIFLIFVLIFDILYNYYKENGFKINLKSEFLQKLLLYIPLSFIGFVFYTIYLNFKYHDPLIFKNIQIAWGQKINTGFIFETIFNTFQFILLLFGTFFHTIGFGYLIFLLIPIFVLLYNKYFHPTLIFFVMFFELFFIYTLYKYVVYFKQQKYKYSNKWKFRKIYFVSFPCMDCC